MIITHKFNNSKDKLVGLVEGIKDLIAGHRDGLRPCGPPFYLNKA
jgi:hypothetical protein